MVCCYTRRHKKGESLKTVVLLLPYMQEGEGLVQ